MRLIDADKLGLTDFELIMCKGSYKECLKMLIDKIENAPTAFDKEKVIEELNQKRIEVQKMKNNCIALSDNEVCDIENATYVRAIEIVERGGVND